MAEAEGRSVEGIRVEKNKFTKLSGVSVVCSCNCFPSFWFLWVGHHCFEWHTVSVEVSLMNDSMSMLPIVKLFAEGKFLLQATPPVVGWLL